MKVVAVIPARLASTRLPEKPLIDINGKSVLRRTHDQCVKAVDKEKTYVATDSKKIYSHCEDYGINVVMTSTECLTGTDRVAEFSKIIDADYYVNVQGDEPIINPEDIRTIIDVVKSDGNSNKIYNGYSSIDDKREYESLSIPKVVMREDKRLLYMSRSPIPGNKEGEFKKAWKQICIYGFPKEALNTFAKHKSKTELESVEDIEILRFLESGFEVSMVELSGTSIAVDTPEDVEKVKKVLDNANQ